MQSQDTTRIKCPNCQAIYEIPTETFLLKADADGKRRVRCTSCAHIFQASATSVEDTSDLLDLQVEQAVRAEPRFGIPDREPSPQSDAPRTELAAPKDPPLAYSEEGLKRKAAPRKVGFVNEAQYARPADADNAEVSVNSPTDSNAPQSPMRAEPDPLMSRIQERIDTPDDRDKKRSRFWVSFIAICLFLAWLTGLVWWIITEQPEWAKPSYWFNTEQEGATEALPNAADIETEIQSMPLERPAIANQVIKTRKTEDVDVDELSLAGVIENKQPYAIRLELIQAIALDEDDELLRSWTFSPGARTLASGEVLPFRNLSPIAVGTKQKIKFGWQSAIAKLPEMQQQAGANEDQ